MIQNISISPGSDFILITWSAPKFPPMRYTIRITCLLVCNSTEYKQAEFTLFNVRTGEIVDDLLPRSACTLTLIAVYNSASNDDGITHKVFTLNEGKYVYKKNVCNTGS